MRKNGYSDLRDLLAGQAEIAADSYINSPIYYRVTGRKGAKIYSDDHSCVIICNHPHIKDKTIVFPEIGRADYKLTANVLNLMDEPKNGVQLARTTPAHILKLKEQLSKLNSSKAINVQEIKENTLDWRYPVRILDTRIVSAMAGPRFAKIRNKVRVARQSVRAVSFKDIDSLRAMRAVLKYWEGSMIFNSRDTQTMTEFYEEFFNILEEIHDGFDGLIYLQGKKPVGFSVWEVLDRKTANQFINLADSSITGLSDFQIVMSCTRLAEQDVRYLNLGGSEKKSLDQFKQKYQPVKTLPLVSAQVIYEPRHNDNISVQTLV